MRFSRSHLAVAIGLAAMSVAPVAFAQSLPVVPQAPATGGVRTAPQSGGQAQGPVIERIVIDGVQRIEPTTVMSYLTLKEGDPFSPEAVNESLKTLFATGFFADVSIRRDGNNMVVQVVENPIVNRIAFEGNQRIDDDILEAEVQSRPRVVYSRQRVQDDVRRILELYQRRGRFAAAVDPKIIQQPQNRVDVVFEIQEGPLTSVQAIDFIGNSYFSDGALRGIVRTTETRWYRFLVDTDRYDPDQLTFDRELLRRHYLANGFADFRVVSAVAELTEDRSGFYITYTLEEGERYKFGKIDVRSAIKDVDVEQMKALVELQPDEWYDADAVDETIVKLSDALGDLGFAFVDIRPIADRDRDNKIINLTFEIQEGPRVFVERVDIRGNVRTLDRVIRREFQLVEGDAFNSTKLRRSRQRIDDLGFFSKVDVNTVQGSAPDRTVVEVDVEEKSTGELSIGAGFSTSDGALGDISIRERNLGGRGQDLRVGTTLAQSRQSIDLGFTEPYFLDKELRAGFDIFHVQRDQQDESGYDSRETGGQLRAGYDITPEWTQSVRYRYERTRITNVEASASRFIRDQEGEADKSLVGQTISYDIRNSRVDPTDGFIASLTTDLAGLGGDVAYAQVSLSSNLYHSFSDDWIGMVGGEVARIDSLDSKKLRVNDRLFLGGDTLRGFESAGVGPRDVSTDDALGGRTLARGTVELQFPTGLPQEYGVKGAVFSDFGTLTDTEDSGANVSDTGSLRASIGVGIAWSSPFGPIRVDFSQAVLKEDHDETEIFRFRFGTRF